MDYQGISPRGSKTQMKAKPSEYFPPMDDIYSRPVDKDALELFACLAEGQVKAHTCTGISTVRLWLDAHAAEEKDNATDPYQQYLTVVRKTAGRLLAEELQCQQIGTARPTSKVLSAAVKPTPTSTTKTGHNGEVSMSTQAPKAVPPNLGTSTLGKLNPQAKPFFPPSPASKQTPHPDEGKPAAHGLAAFKAYCKKRGLRVSSAKKE
ncbi:hypothetical protein F5Y13DRAFT_175572 [Hypoxylon sp. FL1857]|nr:hypothetical protein F5Y13DRAFT_175572 [Hypoxylon sp. FL1857]